MTWYLHWSIFTRELNRYPHRRHTFCEILCNRHILIHFPVLHARLKRGKKKPLWRSLLTISCTHLEVVPGFMRRTRRRQRRGTKGAGTLISAPGARLVALHRPASIRTAYFRSPFCALASSTPPQPPPLGYRFHERRSHPTTVAFDAPTLIFFSSSSSYFLN